MVHIKSSRKTKLATSQVFLLLCILLFFDPRHLAIPILTLPFVLLFGALFYGSEALQEWYAGHNDLEANLKRKRSLSLLVASVPVSILILGSINQLTLKDILLFGILLITGSFYMKRANFNTS